MRFDMDSRYEDVEYKREFREMQGKCALVAFVLFLLVYSLNALFKPSINDVDMYTLDERIKGVGEIKATKIIEERDENGAYLDKKDFRDRTRDFVGEKVYKRIVNIYAVK